MTFLHYEPGWMQVRKPGQFEEKGTGAKEGGKDLYLQVRSSTPAQINSDRKLLPPDTSPAASWSG